jgi:hypothetical protein
MSQAELVVLGNYHVKVASRPICVDSTQGNEQVLWHHDDALLHPATNITRGVFYFYSLFPQLYNARTLRSRILT